MIQSAHKIIEILPCIIFCKIWGYGVPKLLNKYLLKSAYVILFVENQHRLFIIRNINCTEWNRAIFVVNQYSIRVNSVAHDLHATSKIFLGWFAAIYSDLQRFTVMHETNYETNPGIFRKSSNQSEIPIRSRPVNRETNQGEPITGFQKNRETNHDWYPNHPPPLQLFSPFIF